MPAIAIAELEPQLGTHLLLFSDAIKAMRPLIQALAKRLNNGDLASEHGISLLEVKSQSLLEYLQFLVYFMKVRASGEQWASDSAVEVLVENRLILEKVEYFSMALH